MGLTLSLLAARPAQAQKPPWNPDDKRAVVEELTIMRREMQGLMDELDGFGPLVKRCHEELEGGRDGDPLMQECYSKVKAVSERDDRLSELIDDFDSKCRVLTTLVLAPVASRAVAKKPQVKGSGDFEALQRFQDFYDAAREARYRVHQVLPAWAAYQKRVIDKRNELSRRRTARQVASGAAILGGAALLLYGYWRRRQARAVVTLGGPEAGRQGALAGKYRIDGELGRGGMGTVLDAFDLDLKRAVAIKSMNLEPRDFPEGRDLFLREAQLVASLKHPNIVEIYELLEEQGRLYLVFERVSGGGLDGLAGGGRKVPLKWAKEALSQVCLALEYAHGKKVIHRDLKLSNVMLGSDGLVKVMDFGIARQLRGTSITRTQAWGTPSYMAPEQELGEVSRASDVYALGVCLYEMTTGRLPFSGQDLLGRKQRMEYAAATRLVKELPRQLDEMLRRVLEADPAKRLPSVSAFATALQALPG